MDQDIGLNRNTLDKFYTKLDIVHLCKEYIINNININKKHDLIIEPSAGEGSFISMIKLLCNNYKFYDIEPNNYNIEKLNYFDLQFQDFKNKYKQVHIIGNPPFGRQSSLALQFIRFSAQFCDSISFILPKSFKKDSFKNKVPLNFHCIYEVDLPPNSFLLNAKEYDVPCIFQIWIKKPFERTITQKLIPYKFSFVKKNENPHISFRRVGVYAGKIDTNILHKSVQSHYFIKFDDNIYNEKLLEKLSTINFSESSNTVGPKSISKQELMSYYNPILLEVHS